MFDYEAAFSRNIGWVTESEQSKLRKARVAIGGLGGVGDVRAQHREPVEPAHHLVQAARPGPAAWAVVDDQHDDGWQRLARRVFTQRTLPNGQKERSPALQPIPADRI